MLLIYTFVQQSMARLHIVQPLYLGGLEQYNYLWLASQIYMLLSWQFVYH